MAVGVGTVHVKDPRGEMESMAQRDHEVSLDLQGPEERRVRWEFRALKEGRDLLA